jgi:CRISPR-associated protein Csd1
VSWIEQLSKTYDACFGRDETGFQSLTAVSTVPQTTQLHIQLKPDGTFFHAEIDELENTPMFVTEDSASRSGKEPAANPLTEQLEYCAQGVEQYGGNSAKHKRYLKLLNAWADSPFTDPKVLAVRQYIQSGTLLKDLVWQKILSLLDNSIEKVKVNKKSLDPLKLWIRWSVIEYLQSATWSDTELATKWIAYEGSLVTKTALCMASGEQVRTTQKHPKRIRFGGDNSKLISSNDTTGFTFRGRFKSSDQALTISYQQSQKAHNALRWLIARQGTKNGDQVVVAWAVQGALAPPLLVDSWQFLHSLDDLTPESEQKTGREPAEDSYQGDAGQHFALRLKKAVQGYKQKIDDNADIVVMGLDSATSGRMAILFYRELKSFEFLARLQDWHESLAWPQNMGKSRHFVGAPAPRDIAEAAYGQRIDDKLRKATLERLLPCIVDGRTVPRDLVQAVIARTTNRAGLDAWEFERNLGIACSLFRASRRKKEKYTMSLDESRTTRDYLYGRLLAIADNLEEMALRIARQDRDTNAARLMQRFADHPYTTWLTLYAKQLRPYIAQLHSTRGGPLYLRQKLIDTIVDSFEIRDGQSTFLDNRPLTGEFLLGYHSQREALRTHPQTNNTSETTEGDAE